MPAAPAGKAAVDGNVPEHRQPQPRRGLDFNIGKVKPGAWGLVTPRSLPSWEKGLQGPGSFHSYQKETLIFFVRPADKKLPSCGCERQTPAWPVGACAAANYSRCHGGK